jgi:uncharacterized protein with HEPN domain
MSGKSIGDQDYSGSQPEYQTLNRRTYIYKKAEIQIMHADFSFYLSDILQMAGYINEFVLGMTFEEFEKDEKTILAVQQAFVRISRSVSHIPHSIQTAYPEIEWENLDCLGNQLVNQYYETQSSTLWKTIQNQIPHLLDKIPEIIRDHGGE